MVNENQHLIWQRIWSGSGILRGGARPRFSEWALNAIAYPFRTDTQKSQCADRSRNQNDGDIKQRTPALPTTRSWEEGMEITLPWSPQREHGPVNTMILDL